MNGIMLDTNSILRFLLNDIPDQSRETAKIIKKAKSGKIEIFISQIVIFEITFTLEKYYKLGKDEIIDKIESMVSSPYFNIQDKEAFTEAIKLFKDNNIDFVDCFLVVKSNQHGVELFTFDKRLKKLSNNS